MNSLSGSTNEDRVIEANFSFVLCSKRLRPNPYPTSQLRAELTCHKGCRTTTDSGS
jgi:hypothetical protein